VSQPNAMMAGFGWEIGAFESWDTLGVEGTVKKMKAAVIYHRPVGGRHAGRRV